MWKKVTLPLEGIFIKLGLRIFFLSLVFHVTDCSPSVTAVLLSPEPIKVRRIPYNPYHTLQKRKLTKYIMKPLPEDYYQNDEGAPFSNTDSFYMGPDDAMDENKFSQPVIEHQSELRGNIPPYFLSSPQSTSLFNVRHRFRGEIRYPVTTVPTWSVPQHYSVVTEAVVTSDYKVDDGSSIFDSEIQSNDRKRKRSGLPIQPHLVQNNFTHINDSQDIFPSDTVLQYRPRPKIQNNDTPKNLTSDKEEATLFNVPNVTVQNISVVNVTGSHVLSGDSLQKDSNLSTYHRTVAVSNEITTERTVNTVKNLTVYNSVDSTENVSVVPIGNTRKDKLSMGTVAGIVIGVLTCVTLLTSSVIYLLYRRYNGKCAGVDGKFNSDNCGYLDDSLRSSVYLNNHIELPKENSEEMTSLDNDSFLNSLETMTIQNYWADNTKNTKV